MLSIRKAADALRARKVSCVELVQEALRAEEAHRDLNCFITLTPELALQHAKALDAELAAGHDRGPLHGIPIAHKDLYHTAGVRTTNGSRLFADYVPDRDAVAVRQLSDAGAVSLGKLNMHELAYGITSANPHYGPVRNPHDRDADSWRIERRLWRSRWGRHGVWRYGQRHRRIDPNPGIVLWRGGLQADLRHSQFGSLLSLGNLTRSHGSAGE
jgi:hypothetical protein